MTERVNDPEDDTFEVTTPLGTAKAKGDQISLLLLGSIVAGVFLYLLWRVDSRNELDHKEFSEKLSQMVYVLSLTPEERAKLQIDMPPSLRKNLRRHKDDDSR